MSCPYCGRAVDSSDPRKYVCRGCGKFVYTQRSNVLAFIRPSEIEDRFREAIAAEADDNEKKAMEIAEDLVQSTGGEDRDSLFLRGYVYALKGEDGRSLADWKKGLELLSDDANLDAYVCLMAEGVAEMILYKEREFIEFNPVAHIDRLCADIDSSTGMSCTSFVYYTILRDCIMKIRQLEEGERNEFGDVVPDLFRRVVAYQRNYWVLPQEIDEYLDLISYNEETYVEDENEVPHVYHLMRDEIRSRIAGMTDEDRIRIFDHWDDASLSEQIEPLVDAMVGPKRGGFLAKFRKKDEAEDDPVESIRAYADRCLLIGDRFR